MRDMHSNRIWLAFLAVLMMIVVGYSAMALYRLYHYYVLSGTASASQIEWSTHRLSDDEYVVDAKYDFPVKGVAVNSESTLKDPVFRNAWAAEQAIKEYQKRAWKVYYNPGNPTDSTLQKYYPLKECISASILWGLVIYFIGLGYYVKKVE